MWKSIAILKKNLGYDYPAFEVPEEVFKHCKKFGAKGRRTQKAWKEMFKAYAEQYPELAAQYKATDIHIKPNEEIVRIRIRVDGELRVIATPPISSLNAIISRIKVMSDLNIAEKNNHYDNSCY